MEQLIEYVIMQGQNHIYQISDHYTDGYKRKPETYKVFRSQTEAELFLMLLKLEGNKAWTE